MRSDRLIRDAILDELRKRHPSANWQDEPGSAREWSRALQRARALRRLFAGDDPIHPKEAQ